MNKNGKKRSKKKKQGKEINKNRKEISERKQATD